MTVTFTKTADFGSILQLDVHDITMVCQLGWKRSTRMESDFESITPILVPPGYVWNRSWEKEAAERMSVAIMRRVGDGSFREVVFRLFV